MVKKLLVFSIVLLLMVSSVSAFSLRIPLLGVDINPEEQIEEVVVTQGISACTNKVVYVKELNVLSNHDIFNKAVRTFEVGYHVVTFKDPSYKKYMSGDTYTVFMEEGNIVWVKEGICAEDGYKQYYIDYDIEKLKSLTEGDGNIFMLYDFLQSIDGLERGQRLDIIWIALTNGLSDIRTMEEEIK